MSDKPAKTAENLKKLKPREQLFVESIVSGKSQTQGAIDAGYSENGAQERGSELMSRPQVRAAVAAGLDALRERTKFTQDSAMERAKEAYEVARLTENANAMVKAAELMSKLNGLLIERHHLQVETVDIKGALIEAKDRAREVKEISGLPYPSSDQSISHACALLDGHVGNIPGDTHTELVDTPMVIDTSDDESAS